MLLLMFVIIGKLYCGDAAFRNFESLKSTVNVGKGIWSRQHCIIIFGFNELYTTLLTLKYSRRHVSANTRHFNQLSSRWL